MVGIILSVLSLLIIVFVTVVLINKSIDEETQRRKDIKSVVDQVNSTNDTASGVEVKQNEYMKALNTNISTLETNTTSVKNDVSNIQKTMVKTDDLKAYPKIDEISKEVNTASISFNKKSSITHGNGLAFNMGSGAEAKNMAMFNIKDGNVVASIGGDITLTKDSKGENIISTSLPNSKLRIQNNNGPGIIIQNNKVGIGSEPKNATLDVNGSIYAKDGIVTVVNGKVVNILSGISNDGQTMFLNKDRVFPEGVNVNGNISSSMVGKFTGGIETKGGSSIHNPKSEKTSFASGTDGLNYLRGDTEVKGNINIVGGINMIRNDPGAMIEKKYGDDSNRYGVGQFPNGSMRMYTSSSYGPASVSLSLAKKNGDFDDVVKVNTNKTVDISGDVKMKTASLTRSVFGNATNKDNNWNVYNNDDNNLVFTQGPFGSSKQSGEFNIGRNGNLTTNGNASFKGDVVVGGKITTSGTIAGQQLCTGNVGTPTCITTEDVNGLKMLVSQLKNGSLVNKAEIVELQKQIAALTSRLNPIPAPVPPPLSAPAPAPKINTCNTKACCDNINEYLKKGWSYDSKNFGACSGCPNVSFPNKIPGC